MNKVIKSLLSIVIVVSPIFSQEAKYPFPQRVKYPNGFLAAGQKSDHAKVWYDRWKATYPQACNDNIRPRAGTNPSDASLVEAQGWSMITSAYMGDKELFDALYRYYKSKCTDYGCGMMGWKQHCESFEDKGSAADGDLDVGFSLIVADWQWPDMGYLDKAKSVIKNCEKLIVDCQTGKTITGGCAGGIWGGCNQTDLSYYTPAFFRVFAEVTGNKMWEQLADDTYKLLDNCANDKTGLVPDWHTVTGAKSGSHYHHYRYDACRTPWRLALDYLWNGNEKALAWCKKISTWAYGIGPKNIKDGYNLDGTINDGKYHNMAFVGALSVSAMANSQKIADEFYEEASILKDDFWYSGYLGNCYLFTMTGNMWRPDLTVNKQDVSIITKNSEHQIGRSPASSITLRNNTLTISGAPHESIVTFTSLSGKQIVSTKGTGSSIVINTVGFKRGCYIVTVSGSDKTTIARKTVSLL